MKKLCLILIAWVLCGPLVPGVQAQTFGRVDAMTASSAAYHTFAREGEATVQVMVLGSIGAPGIYEVGEGTDLGQLLALTGGVPQNVSRPDERVETQVRLFRPGPEGRQLVYEASYEELLQALGQYPQVQEGDLLVVETSVKPRANWVEILRTSASLATLAIAVERLISVMRR